MKQLRDFKRFLDRRPILAGLVISLILLVGYIIALLIIALYLKPPPTPQQDIEATVRILRIPGPFGRSEIKEVCVINDNDWTWPVAELRINGRYSFTQKDWTPGEKHCVDLFFFMRGRFGAHFDRKMEIERFEIIVKTKGILPDIMGVWQGR